MTDFTVQTVHRGGNVRHQPLRQHIAHIERIIDNDPREAVDITGAVVFPKDQFLLFEPKRKTSATRTAVEMLYMCNDL